MVQEDSHEGDKISKSDLDRVIERTIMNRVYHRANTLELIMIFMISLMVSMSIFLLFDIVSSRDRYYLPSDLEGKQFGVSGFPFSDHPHGPNPKCLRFRQELIPSSPFIGPLRSNEEKQINSSDSIIPSWIKVKLLNSFGSPFSSSPASNSNSSSSESGSFFNPFIRIIRLTPIDSDFHDKESPTVNISTTQSSVNRPSKMKSSTLVGNN